MPSIKEVGIVGDLSLDVSLFINLINQSIIEDYAFSWNKQIETTYSFAYSAICLEMADIIAYDDYDQEYIKILTDFLNATHACDEFCDSDAFDSLFCSPFDWQNGVCDQACDTATCKFDGGDCNQLCQVYSSNCSSLQLFSNGVCDNQCNTSICDYDKFECINSQLNIEFAPNMTYCNGQINNTSNGITISNSSNNTHLLCEVEWVNDKWCDNNCRTNKDCFYDGDDCQCSTSGYVETFNNCQLYDTLRDTVTSLTGNTNDGKYDGYTTYLDEYCFLWGWIEYLEQQNGDCTSITDAANTPIEKAMYLTFCDTYNQYNNCTQAFQALDINNDNQTDIDEYLINFAAQLNITEQKAAQINCSFAFYC